MRTTTTVHDSVRTADVEIVDNGSLVDARLDERHFGGKGRPDDHVFPATRRLRHAKPVTRGENVIE
jgi:hypothetical protein